jgi:hypothetical protein
MWQGQHCLKSIDLSDKVVETREKRHFPVVGEFLAGSFFLPVGVRELGTSIRVETAQIAYVVAGRIEAPTGSVFWSLSATISIAVT